MKDSNVYLQQYALSVMGFDPGELDGVDGPKTQLAKSQWLASRKTTTKLSNFKFQSERWERATIKPSYQSEVAQVASRILSNQSRYEAVSKTTGVPWYVIGSLHNMESGGSFRHHLHEGSQLTGRTKYVPKGRPIKGEPPFTWEESAEDALIYDGLNEVNWSDLNEALQAVEKYNGLGYQKHHPDVPSPYLWSATTVEKPGKYVADGKWDDDAISKQIGIAAIWKELQSRGAITL